MSNATPNIVVVVIDALRRDYIGSYSEESLTPIIDEIASESLVFDQAYSTTNATDPAMLAMLSGRYPTKTVLQHGTRITELERQRAYGTQTAPKLLSDTGYHTVSTGRGLGRWFADGFDEAPEPSDLFSDTEKAPLTKFRQELETRIGSAIQSASPQLANFVGRVYRNQSRSEMTPVRDLVDAVETELGPFFALSHLMDTHAGYEVKTQGEREFSSEGEPLIDIADRLGRDTPTGERCEYFSRKFTHLSQPVTTGTIEDIYRVAVERADRRLELLLDRLDLDETWVFVTADHGESLTEHGIYHDHHGLYDVSVRVPLVVRPPGGLSSQQRTDELVQLTDIAPTMMDIAGIEKPAMEGQSLLSFFDDDDSWKSRQYILADEAYTQRRSMIRSDEWKLLFRPKDGQAVCRYCDQQHGDTIELFNISSDPDETDNLVLDNMDLAARLLSEREDILASMAPEPERVEADNEDQEAVEAQLEALGYK